ncbi:MAG TPA: zinc-binding alcohol dehydrogenase [Rubrobacteraceae bacterium]|nr:zinc-binding alcohol dehydrogenase [Rubrobacteraceae bacterium]
MSAEPCPPGWLDARAVWFAAPRTAELRRERVPPPGPGEVRVRSVVSAISHGTEMLVYRGEVPEGTALDLPTFAGDFSFPIKHGYATVGRVLDSGAGHLSPGDLLFVHHPHQEVFTVAADLPVRLPNGTDPTTGVFFANLETALNVVHDTPLRLGETALVFGQGVVGLLITQLLKRAGASQVLIVDPIEKRRKLALGVGADAAFEPGEDLRERILEATAGRGADVAIEASSSGAALQAAVDAVAAEGAVVVASWYGTKPVTLSLGGHFHRGRVRVRSSQVGRINPGLGARWDRDRRTAAVLDLLPRLRLKELISHRIPLEDAPRAYRLVDEDPGETVQVVLTHGGG